MPTYYSRNTSIQLAVADLQDTTTISPESRAHSTVHFEVTSCAAKFARASINGTLDEAPILTEDANQTHVRSLGKFSEMPFFIVRAGMSIFSSELEGRRSRRPARVPSSIKSPVFMPRNSTSLESSAASHSDEARGANTPGGCAKDYGYVARPIRPSMTSPSARAVPHALFLSVFLSKASFLPTYVHHLNKIVFHDVKIDVFFNGELCASAYVSGRFHGDAFETTEQIIRFSGRKVHRLLEKPWILVPSGQHADGRSRPERHNMESSGDAKQRWVSVSKALMMEADKLEKRGNGELSKLGDYLSALATLEMPTEVKAMQIVGDPKIGIIDVVITAGKGQKDHAKALRLMKPTPMRLEDPKEASAPMVSDNVQDGSVSAGRFVHQEAITEAQSPSLTLDETFTTPTKERRSPGSRADGERRSPDSRAGGERRSLGSRAGGERRSLGSRAGGERRSLGSRADGERRSPGSLAYGERRSPGSLADGEILAQGFTSEPRGLRSQSGLANDPVSSGNHTKPLSREGARSNDPLTKNPHINSSFNFQSSSTNPISWPKKELHFDKAQKRLQSPLVNLPNASQGTFGRALAAKSTRPKPVAPVVYMGNSAASRQRPERKSRGRWEIVVDNKLTLEEEMESIAAEAARATSKLFTQPSASSRASRTAVSNPSGFDEQRSLLRQTGNSKRRKLYIEAASNDDNDDDNNASANEAIATKKKSLIVKLKLPRRPRKRPPPFHPLISPSPAPAPEPEPESSAKRSSTPANSPVSPISTTWTGMPPLSEDAVVTYAPGNELRQVKSERPGWFVEESILMGVRFLLG